MKTPLCQTLGIELPIVQAPIGSETIAQLAAAVSNSGGLGMLSVTWRSETEIRSIIQHTKTLTNKPYQTFKKIDRSWRRNILRLYKNYF